MKNMRIQLQDTEGEIYHWTIRRSEYVKHGWEFTDHQGYTRINEGNWRALVFRFKRVAGNYGLTLMSELAMSDRIMHVWNR